MTQTLPQSNDGNNRSVTVPHARPPPASRDTENSGIRTTLRRCGTAPGATLSKNEVSSQGFDNGQVCLPRLGYCV